MTAPAPARPLLVTAADGAAAVRVATRTLLSWERRGRLARVRTTAAGRPLYRLSEVYAAERRARETGRSGR